MKLKQILEERYATKLFDGKPVPEEKLNELLEIIRLAPSSFGLQPWVVKIISDKETKERLSPATWNQPQINSSSHVLVFTANTDVSSRINKYEEMLVDSGTDKEKAKGYTDMMRGFEEGLSADAKKAWAQRQAYLAVENAVLGAKDLGFDSCPMEGFSPEKYSEILELPENLIPTAIVTIGYAADKPMPKIRYPKEDLFI